MSYLFKKNEIMINIERSRQYHITFNSVSEAAKRLGINVMIS